MLFELRLEEFLREPPEDGTALASEAGQESPEQGISARTWFHELVDRLGSAEFTGNILIIHN